MTILTYIKKLLGLCKLRKEVKLMLSLSVLLVEDNLEDNLANQAVVKAMLGRFAVNLTMVASAELGIESAMKFNFDLILMDFQLP